MKSRLLAADLLRLASIGLRTRRLRAVLSALGIAIGIASMVAVLGISQSSKADLLDRLDRLGTNLLTVAPGQSFFGDDATLPTSAAPAIRGLPAVQTAAATSAVSATLRRTDRIPPEETNGIGVVAADPGLVATVGGTLADGAFLNPATIHEPVVVLGADAASRLGIASVATHPLVLIDGRWFAVAGVLAPLALAPELDSAALIGFPLAKKLFGIDGSASAVYGRA
jgi:putative ABC transport system permease protein